VTAALVTARRVGSGGSEPWASALRGGGLALELVSLDPTPRVERLDVRRWTSRADVVDRAALAGLTGPLLDVGSGPGRMIRAARDAGLEASGIDADPAAVETSRAIGLPVLEGSVFDPLPDEGAWGSVLLLDGNVGIGGDVEALLARCAALLRRGGVLVAEADPDPTRDEVAECRVRDAAGGESDPFPWSRVGLPALLRAAHDFELDRVWEQHGRWFARLRAL
jgi:SAM-dependent methyltransferase